MKPADKGVTYYRMAGVKSQQERFEDRKSYLEFSLKQGFDVLTTVKSDERFTKFRETELHMKLLENQTLKGK